MDLDAFTQTTGEWLRGTGADSDIVVSSRIRLARNLMEFPFPSRADLKARAEVETLLRDKILGISSCGRLNYESVETLPELDRQFLVERQLISREHSEKDGPRGVAVDPRESVSLMINEEDHLRMQVFRSGLALEECWAAINRIDTEIEESVSFAFSEEFGYLTSCPTNVGTGMRVSVLLHLPALVLTKEIQKVFQAMHKMSLAVRGLYGEGSQAMGDFYQISNQITLGKSEEQLVQTVKSVVPGILDYERRVRDALVKEDRNRLHDQISRAVGILRSAQTINSEETLQRLSLVRLGINLGLIDNLSIPLVNELFLYSQPAHLQKVRHERLETSDRNAARASYLRQRLARSEPSAN
ncbi:MAG: protein arginine kinase [Planctomyces sp.]|nr:protein arginine kinase [Planctomyces sp.]